MRFIDEYRDATATKILVEAIRRRVTQPWTIMEICGGQTHAILRFGLDRLLSDSITLVHGPGCPVCVTPVPLIDAALALAERGDITLCSFGDMLRVPGTASDLLAARARGGDVRTVYSPFDAVRMAAQRRDREFVFFAVGFETTAPAQAMAVLQARQLGLKNFSLLASQMLVPPAIAAILSAPDNGVRGFLAAGHVCTVTGVADYELLAARFHVPIVVTGFEPVDLLRGVLMGVIQLEAGQSQVTNAYGRVARPEGNLHARRAVETVFRVVDREWRGLGEIPRSGLGLRPEFIGFDALQRFRLTPHPAAPPADCIAGRVLCGRSEPTACPAFGSTCTPDHPVGAPMVSSEGACAAYFRYRRSDHRAILAPGG